MRVITVAVDDNLFKELDSLMTHRGERSYHIRRAIKRLITELREAKYVANSQLNEVQK